MTASEHLSEVTRQLREHLAARDEAEKHLWKVLSTCDQSYQDYVIGETDTHWAILYRMTNMTELTYEPKAGPSKRDGCWEYEDFFEALAAGLAWLEAGCHGEPEGGGRP